MNAPIDTARLAIDWAAATITVRGAQLFAADGGVWDVEMPDGSWRAANSPAELCDVARELTRK